MERLSYQTLEDLHYQGYLLKQAPERVLQFGEGNFLRAFADYFIDVMNERAGFQAKVVVIQPRNSEGTVRRRLKEQEGLYTLLLQGCEQGREVREKRVISCISRILSPYDDYEAYMACTENPELRFIICNTTEAGICYDASCRFTDRPAASFPAKLTQFLYRRYQTLGDRKGKGFVILACELIDDNGRKLEECVLSHARDWELGSGFLTWLREENLFCSTLVDRIAAGCPALEAEKLCREAGYEDQAIDTAEPFGFWAIEGPDSLREELPFEKAGLPVLITKDHKPYKQRKVRILNGAHTAMIMGAYLSGREIVRECMEDEVIRGFMNKALYEEIIPTLSLPREECLAFAAAAEDRFRNPFLDHKLLSIALNSTAKWRSRVLPSLKSYAEQLGRLPGCLTASLAFYIAFYSGAYFAGGKNKPYRTEDSREVLAFFGAHAGDDEKALAQAVLSNKDFWGEDLTLIKELQETVASDLVFIKEKGAYALMARCRDAD